VNSTKLDHEQVRALYERHGPVLLAYALSLLQDRSASEDVLHQAFMKVLQRDLTINGQPLHYLYRAIRNILHVWGQMTFEEVVAALDISANTVASRYRYALAKLKERLQPLAKE
jgi:DNA-directed RNA polymerase specialized sigma24 family protein